MEFDQLQTQSLHDQGSEMQVICPRTGMKLPEVFIKLLGVDSKKYREMEKDQHRKLLQLKQDDKEITDDILIELEIDKLVSITIGWRGITNKGEPYQFNHNACKELYQNSPYILDQVSNFINNRKSFTNG